MPNMIYVAKVTDITSFRVKYDAVTVTQINVGNPPNEATARAAAKAASGTLPGSRVVRVKDTVAYTVKDRATGATLARVNVTRGSGLAGETAAKAAAFAVRNALAPDKNTLAA